SFANPAKVVELIIKHLPEQTESLIKVTETPVKSALANLPTADLKRIGVTVTQTGDQVYIAPTDSEIDKLVDALVKEAAEDLGLGMTILQAGTSLRFNQNMGEHSATTPRVCSC
uniref:hypothetical protein n=1 Tax=Thalassobaculum salexigens TaxID=455360 RepID=UPI00248EC44C